MNKIFKLVWNATLSTWVVASELATSKTKSSTLDSAFKKMSSATKLATAALLFGAGSINVASAAPGNTCLVNGTWVTAPSAPGDKALACGEGASAAQANDLAIGTTAKADGAVDADGHVGGAIAIGTNSKAQLFNAIALGTGATAYGSQTMALGQGAVSGVSGNTSIVKSLALGFGAQATEGYTVGIGSGTKATGYSSVSIGNAPIASGANGIAVGTWTIASGINSTGIGNLAVASDSSATAVGDRAKASALSAIALGTSAHAEGRSSIAIGADNVVTGSGSGSIGTGLTSNFKGISGNNSYALGNGNTVANNNTFVVGNNITATQDNSVVLGNKSTDRAALGTPTGIIDGTTYNYAGGSPSGVVSVGSVNGERQIINVAAGQVNSTSTDAINGSQLNATNQALSAVDANAVKYDDSTHNTITLGGDTYDNSTHVGGTKITNVANGVADSDAVNMSQLNQTNTQVATNTTNINNLSNDALHWDSSLGAFSASHGGTTVNKITNVGAGELSANSKDAVNGSQLFALGQQVTGIDNRVTNIEGNINSITNGGGIKYFHANSAGADSVASGAESVAIGPNAEASGAGSVASGNGANASGGNAVAVGNGAKASADGSVALGSGSSDGGRGAQTYTGKYSGADNSTSGTVSVGNAATGETRTVSNVADGKDATDAVNLRQLDGAVAESKKYTDDSLSTINNSVVNQDKRITSVDNRVTQAVTNVTNLQNGTDGMFQVNNTSNLPKPSATGEDSMAGGAGAKASGKNSSAVGTNAIAAGNNSTATGNGANAKADNSVALGANSVADRANSVSVGAAGSERQITNVAGGTAPTDAVNLSQLNKGVTDATNNANAYTNSVYSALNKDIKQLDDDLSAGVAGAMAMAALPQPYAAGASMTSGSMGTYRGESAMALGVSRISDNGRWVTKLQATTNTQREFGASVGVGYQW
jgi:autotransporter adhesin